MARSHQKTNTLGEQVAQLAAQVQQLRAELEDARGGGNGSNGHDAQPKSRRDLLRMAGVAAVGAAGALVVRGTPAHALVGDPVILGADNDSSATTNFTPTSGTEPAPLVQAVGQGVTPPTVPATTECVGAPLTRASCSRGRARSQPSWAQLS